jgi:peptidoglycan/xylan/chitin deacetylase (PgdA/CDA1 family)
LSHSSLVPFVRRPSSARRRAGRVLRDGQNVASYPSIRRTLRSYGNLVGNHTWSHPDLTLLSNTAVTSHLNRMEYAHDGGGDRSQTVAAVDILIPKLRARGYVIGLMAC